MPDPSSTNAPVLPVDARKRNKKDSFEPKWRHFPPQSTVYVKNPFDFDIVFQVADHLNRPVIYRMPANAKCELPGGAIATLGVKKLVDMLIGQSTVQSEPMRIWEKPVRAKYEAQVIERVKEPPAAKQDDMQGEVSLATPEAEEQGKLDRATKKEAAETPFPDARRVEPEPDYEQKPPPGTGWNSPPSEAPVTNTAASLAATKGKPKTIEEDVD